MTLILNLSEIIKLDVDLADKGVMGESNVTTGPHKHQQTGTRDEVWLVQGGAERGQLLLNPNGRHVVEVDRRVAVATNDDFFCLREVDRSGHFVKTNVVEGDSQDYLLNVSGLCNLRIGKLLQDGALAKA